MDKVKDILTKVLKKSGWKKYLESSIIFHWRKIVGEDIAKHTNPISLQRGILSVIVDNPAWCHNLMMIKKDIIKNINNYINENIVIDIKFFAGNLRKDQNEEYTVNESKYSMNQLKAVRLTDEEINEISAVTEVVCDEKIKEKLKNLMRIDIASKTLKKQKHWKRCLICNRLCQPDQKYCTVCNIEHNHEMKDQIRKILTEAPWVKYQECRECVDCNYQQYKDVKNELLNYYQRELFNRRDDNIFIATLVMLYTGLTPENVTNDIIENVLQKIGRKNNVFAPRR